MKVSPMLNREDEVLLRMLKTPPKPHAQMKYPRVKKVKPSRASRSKAMKVARAP